jgi:hypothetical protein
MFAIIQDNEVKQLGEPAALFPNTSGANAAFALEQGALEVVEGERKDERFYWVSFSHYDIQADKVVRVYTNTPKELEDATETPEGANEPVTTKGLKSVYISQAKAAAGSQLAQTDWMITRKFERGIEIPADIAAERAKIIADCDAKEAAIQAATTVEELIAVI